MGKNEFQSHTKLYGWKILFITAIKLKLCESMNFERAISIEQ